MSSKKEISHQTRSIEYTKKNLLCALGKIEQERMFMFRDKRNSMKKQNYKIRAIKVTNTLNLTYFPAHAEQLQQSLQHVRVM